MLRGTTYALLEFRGSRSVVGELTWSQWSTLHDIRAREPEGYRTNVMQEVTVENCMLEDMLQTLRVLVERHESLRTRYIFDANGCRQSVAADGSISVVLNEVEDDDYHEASKELGEQLQNRSFDLANDWPLRIGVVTTRGVPRYVVLVMSHMAVDAWSANLLRLELSYLIGSPKRRSRSRCMSLNYRSPVDQADYERSSRGESASRKAIAYFKEQLSIIPHTVFSNGSEVPSIPRWWGGFLDSQALALSVRILSDRYKVTPATLLLAATAIILGYRAEVDRFGCISLAGNRFAQESCEYVGTLVQGVVTSVDLCDTEFSQFVRRTHVAALSAYRHGWFDFRKQQTLIDQVTLERGLNLDLGYFNFHHDFTDHQPYAQIQRLPADVLAMRAATRFSWSEKKSHHDCVNYYMRVIPQTDVMTLALFVDTVCISLADAKAILYGIESTLVEAVSRDFRISEINEIAGVSRPTRDSTWIRIDGSWVSLTATESLLRDAIDLFSLRVFVDGQTQQLVAFLVPQRSNLTPVEIHRLCVSFLPQHKTAMTPQWYVICDSVPTKGDGPDAWAQQAVLTEGNGRDSIQ